ncbi:MAG: GNAT family N-acetyltransferase [Aquihabitans sp.]
MTTAPARPLVASAQVSSPASPSVWASSYEADRTALPTQSPAWRRAMEATGDWRDASRQYRFADGTEVILPLVRRRGALAPLALGSMPDAWGFGGVVGPDLRADQVAAVLADLRSIRAGWIRIRPNPLHADLWAEAAARGPASATLAVPRRAHVLALDRSADEIFTQCFTSSCRRAVRSAEKAGIEVEVDTTGAACGIFHDLLLRSVDRWAGSQHEPLALAHWRANRRDPVAKFEAWADALGDGCRILVARRAGTPIAAMIVLQGHNAHMTRSAMDKELVGHDRPNELLMWHAIRDAVDAGCESFHLGESGTSVNLSRYKEKYGAVGTDYAEHRIEHLPATRADRAARGAVKRIVGFQG